MSAEYRRLRAHLLFETRPADFAAAAQVVRADLDGEFATATPDRQAEMVETVAGLAIDMRSYLARWHLLAPRDGGSPGVEIVHREADRNLAQLRAWGADGAVAEVEAEVASIADSNLRRLSELTDEGELNCRWGHDAAYDLTRAIRRGAVLATTNPVMINALRQQDPATWDPVRDALKVSHPDATPEERVSLMTMEVVLQGCRELRPIWQATGGRYGYVSLQISPRAKDDADRMTEEVQDLFVRLTRELGGVPNARFKIPGTRAGLEAVRRLTAEGIGVTVTVSASVDQLLAFAEVIERGTAPMSFLTLMMGRLDDPVREELEAAGVADAEEVSRWASVAVLRRSYGLLFEERGLRRSSILAASMRGPWTIDGAISSGPSEVFITCFPDKAADYDSVARPLDSHVGDALPAGVEDRLLRSETFRQAFEVGALAGDAFDRFVPVVRTLEQFNQNYDDFVEYNR